MHTCTGTHTRKDYSNTHMYNTRLVYDTHMHMYKARLYWYTHTCTLIRQDYANTHNAHACTHILACTMPAIFLNAFYYAKGFL